MLFLVFPKAFERNLFMMATLFPDSGFQIVYLHKIFELNDFEAMVVGLRDYEEKQTFYFITSVVGSSDIEFNFSFQQLLDNSQKHFGEKMKKFMFVLCGTCGGCHSDERQKLMQVYQIKEAKKFDRGNIEKIPSDLISSSKSMYSLNIRKDRILTETVSMRSIVNVTEIPEAIAYSSNFVVECDLNNFIEDTMGDRKSKSDILESKSNPDTVSVTSNKK